MSRRTLERFASGDPEAVRALHDEYGRAVFSVAHAALGDRWLAEEAVQQTFLQAWRASGGFDPDRDPGPWLYAIARRVAIDLYRRDRRHASSALDDEPEIVSLPPSFEGIWETWQVRRALDRLPRQEREIVHATRFLGLSQEETADRLGLPLGTVKSASHRAHRRLAEALAHLRTEVSA